MDNFESCNRIVQETGVSRSIFPDMPQQTANASVAKQRRAKTTLQSDNSKFIPFWISSSLIKTLLHQAVAESPPSVAEDDELVIFP